MSDNLAHAISGAGGGVLATILTYPLITLSTRAQTESQRESSSTTLISAAKHIIQREGISNLYSGLPTALYGISLTNFIYYYFYEGSKGLILKKKNIHLSPIQSIEIGAIAGAATVFITNPIWIINTRQQVNKVKKNSSTISQLREIISNDGITGLWAGILPALILVLNPILQYSIFEQLRQIIEKRRKMTPLDFFWIGAIGKVIATTTTYPYITIKSFMHLNNNKNPPFNLDLYRGLQAKLLQSVLTSALLFLFKEQLFKRIKKPT